MKAPCDLFYSLQHPDGFIYLFFFTQFAVVLNCHFNVVLNHKDLWLRVLWLPFVIQEEICMLRTFQHEHTWAQYGKRQMVKQIRHGDYFQCALLMPCYENLRCVIKAIILLCCILFVVFLQTVHTHKPHFVALHCQEVGGKNYEESMAHVDSFVK